MHCEKKNIIISETNKDIAIFRELFPIIKGKECACSPAFSALLMLNVYTLYVCMEQCPKLHFGITLPTFVPGQKSELQKQVSLIKRELKIYFGKLI